MNDHEHLSGLVEPVFMMSRDIMKQFRQHGALISDSGARFLVDHYDAMQDQRIRAGNQIGALKRLAEKAGRSEEPHEALDYLNAQFSHLEKQIGKMLAVYVSTHEMGWFFEQTMGIGPILAAKLLAHIDITKAPTAGHIFNYAGLNPERVWAKGQLRPFNARLKKACWLLGDSFVKTSSREGSYYGKLYRARKREEWARNVAGELVEQAEAKLGKCRIGESTDAIQWYEGRMDPRKVAAALDAGDKPGKACAADAPEAGVRMLPPAHIDARARRWAVKLFLSHLHERWYESHYGEKPPKPFAIAQLGHAHQIHPPQVAPKKPAATEPRQVAA